MIKKADKNSSPAVIVIHFHIQMGTNHLNDTVHNIHLSKAHTSDIRKKTIYLQVTRLHNDYHIDETTFNYQ